MLIALPVAKLGAARVSIVAVAVGASAAGAGTCAIANTRASASAGAALGVAVQIEAWRASAVFGAVHFPPAAGDRAGRAGVQPCDRAAELGIPRVAHAGRSAHGRVSRGGAKEKFKGVDDTCRSDQRSSPEKPTAAEPTRREVNNSFCDTQRTAPVAA